MATTCDGLTARQWRNRIKEYNPGLIDDSTLKLLDATSLAKIQKGTLSIRDAKSLASKGKSTASKLVCKGGVCTKKTDKHPEKKATKTVSELQKENRILKGQLKKMLAANAKQVKNFKKYAKASASDSDSDSGSDSE